MGIAAQALSGRPHGAMLVLALAGCAQTAPPPRGLVPPPALAARPEPAQRAVAAPPRRPLALDLTRTILDWTHAVAPLGRLPGQEAGAGASGFALDLPDAPLGAYLRTGAAPAAGLRLDAGARGAALGLRAGPEGPGLTLGLEEDHGVALLGGVALHSRLRVEDRDTSFGFDLADRLAGTDYRLGVQAGGNGALDLQSRTSLPGGVQLRTYWSDPLAGTGLARRRLDLSFDPGGPGRYADTLGARCDAHGPQLGCGFELGFDYRAMDVRISPQWRSDPLVADDGARGALTLELIGALQRLELEWSDAGPALGYRLDIPLP